MALLSVLVVKRALVTCAPKSLMQDLRVSFCLLFYASSRFSVALSEGSVSFHFFLITHGTEGKSLRRTGGVAHTSVCAERRRNERRPFTARERGGKIHVPCPCILITPLFLGVPPFVNVPSRPSRRDRRCHRLSSRRQGDSISHRRLSPCPVDGRPYGWSDPTRITPPISCGDISAGAG